MQDDNAAPQAQDVPVADTPVADTPQADTPQAPEQLQEDAPQDQIPVEQNTNPEPVQQPADGTPEAPTASEAPEAAPSQYQYDIRDFMQPQSPNIEPDEEGYIDPNKFYQKVMADVDARWEQKQRFEKAEQKAWQAVEQKYPEIKSDKELRDLVQNQRIADVAIGGRGDIVQIADKLLGKLQSYQNKGKAQAQVSETVQKSAALQRSTANQVESPSKDSDLLERMSRGDENAKRQLISDWLSQGKI